MEFRPTEYYSKCSEYRLHAYGKPGAVSWTAIYAGQDGVAGYLGADGSEHGWEEPVPLFASWQDAADTCEKHKQRLEDGMLRPCPFCGSEKVAAYGELLTGRHGVKCGECLAMAPSWPTRAEAIAAWNKRAREQP